MNRRECVEAAFHIGGEKCAVGHGACGPHGIAQLLFPDYFITVNVNSVNMIVKGTDVKHIVLFFSSRVETAGRVETEKFFSVRGAQREERPVEHAAAEKFAVFERERRGRLLVNLVAP